MGSKTYWNVEKKRQFEVICFVGKYFWSDKIWGLKMFYSEKQNNLVKIFLVRNFLGGHLLVASLKFGQDRISGWWDILILIFWGHLPLGVFTNRVCKDSIGLKFQIWVGSVQWLFRYCQLQVRWMAGWLGGWVAGF